VSAACQSTPQFLHHTAVTRHAVADSISQTSAVEGTAILHAMHSAKLDRQLREQNSISDVIPQHSVTRKRATLSALYLHITESNLLCTSILQ
jgi:hypothetical protein